MPEVSYRDVAEFGLPFVTPDHPDFAALVREIASSPQPMGPAPSGDLNTAAVLLNETGKTIVALAYFWRYRTADGHVSTSRHANLGSSMQLDVLSGRFGVVRDRASFILPGSKRLITEEGMFGDNLDVLPSESLPGGFSFIGTGRSGRPTQTRGGFTSIELQLDVAFLEDGLCVGPDELGTFESVTTDLERQRTAAQEITQALRDGASRGAVFEILRPLAAHDAHPTEPGGRHRSNPSHLLPMFGNMAIHRLVNASDAELLAWFEAIAQPSSIRLHRPS